MTDPGKYLGKPLVVLATGGTGGHMFPAEALAAELAERGCRIALITDRRGGSFSDRFGGDRFGGAEIHRILAAGMARKSFVKRLRGVSEMALGVFQARSLLKRLAPRAVVGFGGYASVPTMLAAVYGGHKTALHEQNAILGRANRLLAPRVMRIATAFKTPLDLPPEIRAKAVHTGMPVRAAILDMRERPYPSIGAEGPIRLMVIGGSQGASVFSKVVPEAAGRLSESIRSRLQITQQCRPEDLEEARAAYKRLGLAANLSSFFDNVPELLAESHLVISRAGASSVAEITTIGRPSILSPYSYATDDHQTFNAHSVDKAGAGWLMPEESFYAGSLAARLESLFDLPAILEKTAACAFKAGAPDAASRLADMVCELLPSNGETEIGPESRKEAA